MKKYGMLIVIAMIIALNLNAGPTPVSIELSDGVTVVKIDDDTCEKTTIKTSTTVEQLDKAELQTELDHIPDRLTELQKQIDSVNERKTELTDTLAVFK